MKILLNVCNASVTYFYVELELKVFTGLPPGSMGRNLNYWLDIEADFF